MTRIVLLFGSGSHGGSGNALATEEFRLARLLREAPDARVDVVSLGLEPGIAGVRRHVVLDGVRAGIGERALDAIAGPLARRLATIPIGRLLNSMGPLDAGRVLWRRVRRSPEALDVLRGADVVLAADAPSVKTAWTAVRRGWAREAYYDHRVASIAANRAIPGS